MRKKPRTKCVRCGKLFERWLREIYCNGCQSWLNDQDYLDKGAAQHNDETKGRKYGNPYPADFS